MAGGHMLDAMQYSVVRRRSHMMELGSATMRRIIPEHLPTFIIITNVLFIRLEANMMEHNYVRNSETHYISI